MRMAVAQVPEIIEADEKQAYGKGDKINTVV